MSIITYKLQVHDQESNLLSIIYYLDMIGVVIFIGDKRMVRCVFEQQNNVSKIIVTDHRYAVAHLSFSNIFISCFLYVALTNLFFSPFSVLTHTAHISP